MTSVIRPQSIPLLTWRRRMYETPTRFQSPYGKTLGAKSRLWRGIKRKVLLSIFINTNMCFKTWSFKQDQNAIRFICTLKILRVYNLYNMTYSFSLGLFVTRDVTSLQICLFYVNVSSLSSFIYVVRTVSELQNIYVAWTNPGAGYANVRYIFFNWVVDLALAKINFNCFIMDIVRFENELRW